MRGILLVCACIGLLLASCTPSRFVTLPPPTPVPPSPIPRTVTTLPATPTETQAPGITLSPTISGGTQQAAQVTGSVLLADGRCCAGGKAGETVNVKVQYSASSPAGEVTEMRVVSGTGTGCLLDAATLDAPWEPFTPEQTLSARLSLNWVGFYVNVQYRDAAGNLSPVYCDDISLEGSPG